MSSKREWGKPFPVMAITREDIVTAGFPQWQAALSDEEMCQIASLVKASYDNEFFLVRIKAATNHVISLRSRPNIIGEPV